MNLGAVVRVRLDFAIFFYQQEISPSLASMLLCSSVAEIYFRMIGVWASLSDAVRSWLRLLTHVKFIPHP